MRSRRPGRSALDSPGKAVDDRSHEVIDLRNHLQVHLVRESERIREVVVGGRCEQVDRTTIGSERVPPRAEVRRPVGHGRGATREFLQRERTRPRVGIDGDDGTQVLTSHGDDEVGPVPCDEVRGQSARHMPGQLHTDPPRRSDGVGVHTSVRASCARRPNLDVVTGRREPTFEQPLDDR